MKISTAFIIIFTSALFNAAAQFSCPDSMIYATGCLVQPPQLIRVYNTRQPVSANNPTYTSIPIGSSVNICRGLALMPNLNAVQPSPTLYGVMVVSSWPAPTVINLCYWNGSAWIDTGVPAPHHPSVGDFNLAGCYNALYSLYKEPIGGGLVQYVVYANHKSGPGLASAVPLFTAQGRVAEDIVCDCQCNIYLLHQDGLRKYDQAGNVLSYIPSATYLNSLPAGFAIIGNTLYVEGGGNGGFRSADISGSSFSLNPINADFPASDLASCPVATTTTVSAIISSGTLGCNPSTLNLVASTTLNPASYQWSGPGIGSSVPGSSVMNVNSAGIYTCHIFEGSCDYRLATLVTTVTSNTTVVSPSILPGNLLCLSPGLKLAATPGPGSYNYQWSGPDISAGQGTHTVTINATGKYEVQVTDPANGCTGIASTSILPVPLLELGISSPTLCVYSVYGKDKATLSYKGANTYTLLLSPGFSVTLLPSQPVVLYQTHSPPGITGAASATLLGGNGVCTGSTVTNFSVLPVTTLVAIPAHTTVCIDSKIQLSASGAQSYTWFPVQAFDLVQHNNVQVTVNKAASYSVQGIDEFGCHTPLQTFFVEVFPLNNGRIKPHPEVCAGQCPELEFEAFNAAPQAIVSTWTVNNQPFSNTILKPCFANPGSYTLRATLTDTNTKCSNGFEYNLNVHPKPKADFSFSPLNPVEGQDEVLFMKNTTEAETDKWYWPDPETEKTKSSDRETLTLRFLSAGKYPVSLVTTNQWTCADTIIKVVEVEEDFLFYIPNTFTPNDDGKNEVFTAVVHGLQSYKIEIFNRWGSLVFSSGNVERGWDGTFKGQPCPDGTYAWKAAVTSKRGTPKEYSGHVLLIR